jgi:hypothetical protein
MTRDRLGTVWAGLALVGLGITFLLAQVIGWDRIWPVFPMLGGIAFLGGYVAGGFREPGFVFIGTAATLVGLLFFGFSLGYWEWDQMTDLWPAFPIIGGIAFVALFAAEGARDLGVFGLGCAAIIVGLAGFGVTYGFLGAGIWRLWPLLLIFLGVVGLANALWRLIRRG